MDLKERIREAINCASAENGSDTPDFILAEYLTDCLAAFDKATTRRTRYFAPTADGKPVPVSPNVPALRREARRGPSVREKPVVRCHGYL